MTFNELLADFGRKLGNGMTLAPDDSGTVNLSVDDLSVAILGLEEAGEAVLSGVVGEIPPSDHQERLFKALLMANHNFAGTNGASFSVNPESGEVSLCRMLPLAVMDGDRFFAEVEHFINTLETWHRIVADFRGAELDAKGETEAAADTAMETGLGGMGGFMQV